MSGAPGMSGPPDLSMIGVAPPPLGVVPNFVDPVNNNAAQLIVTGITLPIAVGFMIMRLMTKALIIHKFSIDDVLIIFGLVFAVVFCSIQEWSIVYYGAGRHLWDMPVSLFEGYLKDQWLGAAIYILASAFIKFSIITFYLRIFSVEKTFRVACKVLLVYVFCLHLSGFLATIFACTPVRKSWDSTIPGHCVSLVKLASVSGGLTASSDFFILLLPLPVIWRLQMETKQKLALSAVFITGIFVCASSLTREIVTIQSQADPDFTWVQNRTLVWYIAETNVGLICACMPALKPFLNYVVGEKLHIASFIHSRRSSRYHSKYNSSKFTTDRSRSGDLDDKYVELGPIVDGAGVPGSIERSGVRTTVMGPPYSYARDAPNSRLSGDQHNRIMKSDRVDVDVEHLDGRLTAV